MPTTIQPAELSSDEASAFAKIQVQAFLNDLMYQKGFGLSPYSSQDIHHENIAHRTRSFEKKFQSSKDGSLKVHYFKAISTENDEIVGFGEWYEPDSRQSMAEMEARGGRKAKEQWPESWDREVLQQVEENMKTAKSKAMAGRDDFWSVGMMAVSPGHQGRGIADALVKRGLEMVDEKGEDVYLDASPAARKLYAKNGFETVAQVELLEGYHSEGMVRKSSSRA